MLITLLKWPPRCRNTTGSRTAPKPFLSDEQWDLIADLFPHPPVSAKGGRPRIEPRACLEGVLWVLKTGARWKDLPERYPSPSTGHRRHRDWTESGVFIEAWRRLLHNLDGLTQINWEEVIADGTFAPAKKGRRRRPNQTRQGHQADAADRRRRDAAVGLHRRRQRGRSPHD